MSYIVRLEGRAERDLRRLPRDVLRPVDAKLLALSSNPRPTGAAKLRGRERDGWGVRAGESRILHAIDDAAKVVSVYRIRPRGSAYR